jgi:hypothetical protein
MERARGYQMWGYVRKMEQEKAKEKEEILTR